MEYAEYFKKLLGLKIKQVRLEYDMTQKEMAKMIGTSQARLASYENGTVMPSNEVIAKMASSLDEKVGFFCNDSGMLEKTESDVGDEYRFLYVNRYLFDDENKPHKNIEDIFKNLNEDNKNVLIQFAKLLEAGQDDGKALENNLEALKRRLRNFDISENSNVKRKVLYDDRVPVSTPDESGQKRNIQQ